MKISRFKKAEKILSFFSTHFNYHAPYQVLIDATFCQAALQHKIIVEEQLKRFFIAQVKLLTTQCIILEAESLGTSLTGATMIVKQFHVHKCGHEGKPVTAVQCILSMTKDSRYIVASQDRSLQERLRKVPGRCLLYLQRTTPVLEEPSKASKKYVDRGARNTLPKEIKEHIVHLKRERGLLPPLDKLPADSKQKRRGSKNPNPLSCKKSKKRNHIQQETSVCEKSKPQLKAKRKRTKVPKHVKAALTSDCTSKCKDGKAIRD